MMPILASGYSVFAIHYLLSVRTMLPPESGAWTKPGVQTVRAGALEDVSDVLARDFDSRDPMHNTSFRAHCYGCLLSLGTHRLQAALHFPRVSRPGCPALVGRITVDSLELCEMDHMVRAIDTVLHLVVAGLQGQITDLGILTQHDLALLADFDHLFVCRTGNGDAE